MRLAAPRDISFEELVAAAAEIGLTREDLKEAERKYAESTTEAGQRAEFRRMQRDQFRAVVLKTCLIGALILALLFFEVGHFVSWLLIPVLLGVGAWIAHSYRDLGNEDLPKHRQAFETWRWQKQIWLRPERAQEIIDLALHEEPTLSERINGGLDRDKFENRLIRRLGYDRVRAKAVLGAYIVEHPEWEMGQRL